MPHPTSRHEAHAQPARGAQRALPRAPGRWVRRDDAILGSAASVELWCDEQRVGEAAAVAVIDEMHRIERNLSRTNPAPS